MNFEELFKGLSSENHFKGKSFEKISKWWLKNDEMWSSLIEEVWLWDEWPKRNSRDLGIDLVAEGIDGSVWAIQCKAYDPNSSLKKSDIDSFLSASSKKEFTHRLLITTTKSIGENARKTISDQEKPVQVVDWIRLSDSEVDWSLAERGLKSKAHTPKELRPHQNKALKSVVRGLQEVDKGQLIMACGTGKTLTGLRISEALSGEVTILLVPSLTLLSQTLKDWLLDRKINFKWIAVCSDDSVTNDPQDNARLVDYDIPATTDLKVIKDFLATKGKKVIFSTYQSSEILKTAILKSNTIVDLVIADEAHRLAGKNGRDFASFLDPNMPIAKRLFMTATPRIYANSIKKMAETKDIEILSMDDEEIFGKILYKYSFSQAISEGILSDYRVVVIGIDDQITKDLFDKRALVKAGIVETDSESLALHVALAKAMKTWKLRRLITFHSRVSKAKKFASDQVLLSKWLPKEYAIHGNLNATTISSSMPTNKRRQILEVLKTLAENEAGMVSNARCLTEGIDVPTLDAVVFVDPKTSQVDIIQAIGRAIRTGGSNKTHGTVVVPIHVPREKNSKEVFDSSSFKKIGDVLNALRAHDEEFGEELDKLRTEMGERSSLESTLEKVIFDLPQTISDQFANKIQALSIELSTSSWEYFYGQLIRFVKENGHARPNSKRNDATLGEWVSKQRSLYRSGQLSEARAEKLANIHPTWTWNPLEDDWNFYLEELRKFVRIEGHARPTATQTADSGLGEWVINQRENFKLGRLSHDRIKALEDTHATWSWNPIEDDWERMFDLLVEYEKSHGDTRVPASYKVEGVGLGAWVHGQRAKKLRRKSRSSELSPSQISKLESLSSWSWNPTEDDFEQYFSALQRYYKKFGNSRVPISFRVDDLNLGKWVSHKRTAYKSDKLVKEIIDLFEDSFPDWSWNPNEDDWEENYKALLSFIKDNGHARVSNQVEQDGRKIGIWVSNLKSRYKAGRLTKEQIERLEKSHPTWAWTLLDQQWYEFYEKLSVFKTIHGHCNVPSKGKNKEDQALYEWINTQRKRFKQGRLPEGRRELLEALGFLFEPIDPWNETFRVLEGYVVKHGSARVPTSYVENGYFLGRWVSTQRGKYRKNDLSGEQIRLLESLKGWEWNPSTSNK